MIWQNLPRPPNRRTPFVVWLLLGPILVLTGVDNLFLVLTWPPNGSYWSWQFAFWFLLGPKMVLTRAGEPRCSHHSGRQSSIHSPLEAAILNTVGIRSIPNADVTRRPTFKLPRLHPKPNKDQPSGDQIQSQVKSNPNTNNICLNRIEKNVPKSSTRHPGEPYTRSGSRR